MAHACRWRIVLTCLAAEPWGHLRTCAPAHLRTCAITTRNFVLCRKARQNKNQLRIKTFYPHESCLPRKKADRSCATRLQKPLGDGFCAAGENEGAGKTPPICRFLASLPHKHRICRNAGHKKRLGSSAGTRQALKQCRFGTLNATEKTPNCGTKYAVGIRCS